MLGFSAISARPISGGAFALVGYAAAIAATGAITFSGSAQWGAFLNASATGRLSFSGSAVWSSLNALTSTGSLTVDGAALLQLAGRPIVFYAIPERLTFVATADRLTFNARADNFTFKGMR
jgi:hypothetical protein